MKSHHPTIILLLIVLACPTVLQGQSATSTAQIMYTDMTRLFGVAGFGSGTFVAASTINVLKTKDSGATWTITTLPWHCSSTDLKFYNDIGILVRYCDIWRSVDSGESWNLVFSSKRGLQLSAVSFIDSQTLVVVGRTNEKLRSTDGGLHWKLLPNTRSPCTDVDFFNDSVGIALWERSHIDITTDAGATWNKTSYKVDSSADPRGPFLGDLSCLSNYITVAISYSGEIYRSEDMGRHWKRYWLDTNDFSFNDVAFYDDRHGVVVGGEQILITSDGGITWEPIGEKGEMFLNKVSFINANQIVAVGEGGRVVHVTIDW